MRMQEPRPGNRGNMLKSKDWRPKIKRGAVSSISTCKGLLCLFASFK